MIAQRQRRCILYHRAGGNGAYIGAFVFPLFAIAAGWGAVRLWKRNGVTRG